VYGLLPDLSWTRSVAPLLGLVFFCYALWALSLVRRVIASSAEALPSSATCSGDQLKAIARAQDPAMFSTHPEDIADKLKAIKEALALIRGPAAAADDAAFKALNAIQHVKSDDAAKEAVRELNRISALIFDCYSQSHAIRYQFREYDDIPEALSGEPDKELLPNLTGRFGQALLTTRERLVVGEFAKSWNEWMQSWRRWRANAEDQLIAAKRQLTR
jgi:hypothetical protein